MIRPSVPARLKLALAGAALTALCTTSMAGAQSGTPTGGSGAPGTYYHVASGPVVQLALPLYPNAMAGNVTFRGLAADCTNGQAASRVAVFDGVVDEEHYVADVSMDTPLNVAMACAGQSGIAPIGFTLIFDSRMLDDGLHNFVFVADYPSGMVGDTSALIYIENDVPYDQQNRYNESNQD